MSRLPARLPSEHSVPDERRSAPRGNATVNRQAVSPVDLTAADHRLRAPQNDGEILAVPALSWGSTSAERNRQLFASADIEIGGCPLSELRRMARGECLQAASVFTSNLLESAPVEFNADRPLFVTGHQPELAHPGVWAKNFAVSALADHVGGIGLNVIVDNDLMDHLAINVPAGSRLNPRIEPVPLAEFDTQCPWEEALLSDRNQLSGFPKRVHAAYESWGIRPLLDAMWPNAERAAQRFERIGWVLSACRIAQERRWSVCNLELPVSKMCDTESFLLFVSHLVVHHERFHACYNDAVHAYRKRYRVKNQRHPVPDLVRRADRYELPFWYWKPGATERHALQVERVGNAFSLFANEMPLAQVPDAAGLIPMLRELQVSGRLRTRALTTTMFTRCCLADLFIHGIGGAKYDEITDRIFSSFLDIDPPVYSTVTATLRLPLGAHDAHAQDLLRLKRRLRDLQFNADRYVEGAPIRRLADRKQQLIRERAAARTTGLTQSERRRRRPQRRARHLELKSIQQELARCAEPLRESTQAEIRTMQAQLQANQVFNSREFPAVLFPHDRIADLIQDIRTATEQS